MQDQLHQQYRTHMFPFEPFIKTALEAGAHGAFLSGSDTMSQFLAEAVSEAMLRVARQTGISGTVHISPPSFAGFNSVGTAADGTVLWSQDMQRDYHSVISV